MENQITAGEKVFYIGELMYLIYQYDSTHIDKHKKLIGKLRTIICDEAHIFWYNKYEKALNNNSDKKYILELQNAFFDTLEQLGFNFFSP